MRSKYEREAQLMLEKDGWRVDNKCGMSRWSQNRDFWNLFDLVALKSDQPLRWISIKGKAGGYQINRKEVKGFIMPVGNQKELWRFTKGLKYPPKIEILNTATEGDTVNKCRNKISEKAK